MSQTNANFWDCECDANYIHRLDTDVTCNTCGAYVDDCPASLQVEVELSEGWEDRHTLSTVHLLDGTLKRALTLQMEATPCYEGREVIKQQEEDEATMHANNHAIAEAMAH